MKEEEDEIKISCLFSKKSSSQFFFYFVRDDEYAVEYELELEKLYFVCMNYDKNQIFELSCLLA
jgi:hypothetical protein